MVLYKTQSVREESWRCQKNKIKDKKILNHISEFRKANVAAKHTSAKPVSKVKVVFPTYCANIQAIQPRGKKD